MSRSSSSRSCIAALAAALAVAVGAAVQAPPAPAAAQQPPWQAAAALRAYLAEAERAVVLGEGAAAGEAVRRAGPAERRLSELLPNQGLDEAFREVEAAVDGRNAVRLAAARATLQTAVLHGAYRALLASLRRGDAAEAGSWLLVREYRPPTRFSRPGADATLAVAKLADKQATKAEALAAVRADYLDTYQARLRTALDGVGAAAERGFPSRLAAESALARGYFAVLRDSYARQRGEAAAGRAAAAFEALNDAALARDEGGVERAAARVDAALDAFRAAPLAPAEEIRRAGQFLRFLALVPVEYGRGVADGRVTLAFEIQEAVTFRDGAAQALADLDSRLVELDPAAAARIDELVTALGADMAAASQGVRVTDEDTVRERTQEALDLAESTFPTEWKEGQAAADFDVIRASLDRVVAAARAGEYGKAEQARLEAYAFFEFGPEQRLRGLAPDLFARTEGLFWYGADSHPGLAQLIRRKSAAEVDATRQALDEALAASEAAVGSGPTSAAAVVVNTAIIVFREGLEAVLILAALTAGLVGAKQRLRRPLLLGAAAALVASVVTFVVAKTVLSSLVRYGERVEAVVSILAVGVLLLILNWFFHRVYWNDHLAGLHGRKKQVLRGAGLSAAAAQFVGLALLGFTAVYREGFETVLFLQAFALEAGVLNVAEGVIVGSIAVAAVGVLTIALQRKLPHRRMLELTGLMILGVLVIMAGKTVQVCQVVGWLPVHPIGELRLPYWAGLWFGVFPTWEGVAAQLGAAMFVLGSYAAAEWLRGRRRRAKLERLDAAPTTRSREPVAVTELESTRRVPEPVGSGR